MESFGVLSCHHPAKQPQPHTGAGMGKLMAKVFFICDTAGFNFPLKSVEHSMRECVCDEPEGTSHGDEACNAAGLV